MTSKIIDGRLIAKKIKKELHDEVCKLKRKYKIKPTIATVIIGNDPSSELYLKLRENACKEVGINTIYTRLKDNVTEKETVDSIRLLNNDESIHGILVQYPVPSHISQNNLISAINPSKDVEGFNPVNIGKTLLGDEYIIPCTPLSVLKIIEHENENIKGKDIVIINHSNVVGKPLAALLLNRNATVSICHIFTKNLKFYSSNADILISAVGKPKFITKEYVKENAFIIDVGIAKTEGGISGDINFESVKEKVGKITPVPGGVGPVTITSSIQNTITLYKNSIERL